MDPFFYLAVYCQFTIHWLIVDFGKLNEYLSWHPDLWNHISSIQQANIRVAPFCEKGLYIIIVFGWHVEGVWGEVEPHAAPLSAISTKSSWWPGTLPLVFKIKAWQVKRGSVLVSGTLWGPSCPTLRAGTRGAWAPIHCGTGHTCSTVYTYIFSKKQESSHRP